MIIVIEKFIRKYKYLLLLALIVLFWLVRVPEFKLGWDGEDGNGLDTDIFVNQLISPNYFLVSRIDGVDHYININGHPGANYAIFSILGSVTKTLVPLDKMTDQEVVTIIKVMVTVVQMLINIGIGFYIIKEFTDSRKKVVGLLVLMVLANSPIALYNSNEFQIDSFLGIILTSVLCFTILPFLKTPQRLKMRHYSLLALSSAFIGLGKTEWSLMLIAAVISVLSLYFIINKFIYKRPVDVKFLKMLGIIFVSNLIGNLFNFLFDRELYIGGFELLNRMIHNATIQGNNGLSWLDVMYARLPFISTIFCLLLILFWMLIKSIRCINYYQLFIFIYGLLLFLGFFISSWGNLSRYFAPGLLTLTFAFVLYFRDFKIDSVSKYLFIGLVVVVGFQSYNLFMQFRKQEKQDLYFTVVSDITDNCIPLIDLGRVYRRPDIDFIHISMGYIGAEAIAKEYGKHICKN